MSGLLRYIDYFEEISDKMFIPRIDREDGLVLYSIVSMLVDRGKRFVAVDAGAGVGYSTIWIAASLEDLCVEGVVYAVEWSSKRFEVLKQGLEKIRAKCIEIKPINRDALEFIKEIREEIDFVFVDIEKSLYRAFFNEAVKKIRRGGVIAFHNAYVTMDQFRDILSGERDYIATIVPTPEGLLLVRILS